MVEYKDVRGFEGKYGVSSYGEVINLRNGCVLEPIRGRYVTLNRVNYRVCDLVANAWVKNPRMWAYVRHKNGDTSDNRAENLEFVAQEVKERMRGATNVRRVLKFSLLGELLCKYGSVSDASYASGVDKSSISKCCRGLCVSAGGYMWRYE